MDKTKIDWCDSTWNPVTGCLHECVYCYARGIARRFGGASETHNNECGMECMWETGGNEKCHILDEPLYDPDRGGKAPYPYDFDPTFHRYRLGEYQKKKGRNIFVCSMADLFGDWVPDSWIGEVFAACEAAPQHNYLFLTKRPQRYIDLASVDKLSQNRNMWFGTTVTNKDMAFAWFNSEVKFHWFLSIEPILEDLGELKSDVMPEWIIVGAETGKRAGKVIPKREWIETIVNECRESSIPVFMKSSLADIWGEPLIQEFPKQFNTLQSK